MSKVFATTPMGIISKLLFENTSFELKAYLILKLESRLIQTKGHCMQQFEKA